MNAMPFRLFREQRPQNIFCHGLFGIDWWFLCKMVLSNPCTLVPTDFQLREKMKFKFHFRFSFFFAL